MIKNFMNLSMEDKIKIISLGLGVLGFLISLTNVIILMYSRKVKLNFGIEQLITARTKNMNALANNAIIFLNVLGDKKKAYRIIPIGFNFYIILVLITKLYLYFCTSIQSISILQFLFKKLLTL